MTLRRPRPTNSSLTNSPSCLRWGLLAVVIAGATLAGCGSSAATKPLPNSQILRYDPTDTTVHLQLLASETDTFNGFNFDGYADGEMRIDIPVGWTVDVTCENESTALTHSCAIVTANSLSPEGGTIAFPGATTPNPVNGLKYHETASFSFLATKAGTYRIDCMVIGHEVDGMWDWLTITSRGRPSITTQNVSAVS
jgi:sulfocyanin